MRKFDKNKFEQQTVPSGHILSRVVTHFFVLDSSLRYDPFSMLHFFRFFFPRASISVHREGVQILFLQSIISTLLYEYFMLSALPLKKFHRSVFFGYSDQFLVKGKVDRIDFSRQGKILRKVSFL